MGGHAKSVGIGQFGEGVSCRLVTCAMGNAHFLLPSFNAFIIVFLSFFQQEGANRSCA